MLSLNICYPKIARVVLFGMTKTVYFQPGCMYRVRVKIGDSNPHIERASPSFIDIQVRIMIVLFFSFSLIYLFCLFFFLSQFYPLHPDVSMHILITVLYTFPKVLTWRICSAIKSFFSW